jgi:hypothetical protein
MQCNNYCFSKEIAVSKNEPKKPSVEPSGNLVSAITAAFLIPASLTKGAIVDLLEGDVLVGSLTVVSVYNNVVKLRNTSGTESEFAFDGSAWKLLIKGKGKKRYFNRSAPSYRIQPALPRKQVSSAAVTKPYPSS